MDQTHDGSDDSWGGLQELLNLQRESQAIGPLEQDELANHLNDEILYASQGPRPGEEQN